jgi:hypothetical protein
MLLGETLGKARLLDLAVNRLEAFDFAVAGKRWLVQTAGSSSWFEAFEDERFRRSMPFSLENALKE